MAVPSTQRRMGALLADGYLRMAHTPLSLDQSHCIMPRGASSSIFRPFPPRKAQNSNFRDIERYFEKIEDKARLFQILSVF